MSRFDYVAYDAVSAAKQAKFKAAAQKIEAAMIAFDEVTEDFALLLEDELEPTSARDIAHAELSEACLYVDAFQRLEQAYMWCGKAIRDDQIARNGTAPLLEERTNS